MGITNWLVSKLTGFPAVGENCDDRVTSFLANMGIESYRYAYVTGERSYTNSNLNQRVYFGTGVRAGRDVGFLLDVNEDIPRPSGAIVKEGEVTWMSNYSREWREMPSYARGSLYNFSLKRMGGELEPLDS